MDRAPPQPAEDPHNHTSPSSSAATPSSSSGHMGKHRMLAAISFLNQQIQTIQEELVELETTGGVSTPNRKRGFSTRRTTSGEQRAGGGGVGPVVSRRSKLPEPPSLDLN